MCVLFQLVIDVVEVEPFLGESAALNYIPCQVEMMYPNAQESLFSITCFIIIFPMRKGWGAKAYGFIAPGLFGDGAEAWNKDLYMLGKHSPTELYF